LDETPRRRGRQDETGDVMPRRREPGDGAAVRGGQFYEPDTLQPQ